MANFCVLCTVLVLALTIDTISTRNVPDQKDLNQIADELKHKMVREVLLKFSLQKQTKNPWNSKFLVSHIFFLSRSWIYSWALWAEIASIREAEAARLWYTLVNLWITNGWIWIEVRTKRPPRFSRVPRPPKDAPTRGTILRSPSRITNKSVSTSATSTRSLAFVNFANIAKWWCSGLNRAKYYLFEEGDIIKL